MTPRIILIGGVSTVGKTTTVNLIKDELLRKDPKQKVVIVGFDDSSSKKLRDKAQILTETTLLKLGFSSCLSTALQGLDFEQRTLFETTCTYCYYSVVHKQMAADVLSHVQDGNLVILDVLNIPNMVYWLEQYLPLSIPVLAVILQLPIKMYPIRIAERNKLAIKDHSARDIDHFLKHARFCLIIMKQIGELFSLDRTCSIPETEEVSFTQIQEALDRAGNVERQLLNFIVDMPQQSPGDANLKAIFTDALRDYDAKEKSTKRFIYESIVGSSHKSGWLTPKFKPSVLINMRGKTPIEVIECLMSQINVEGDGNQASELYDMFFRTNRPQFNTMTLAYSMHLQKKEYAIFHEQSEDCEKKQRIGPGLW